MSSPPDDAPETVLDRHMALVALVISKLVETGLSARDIDSERSQAFLGAAADPIELGCVLMWMVDEEIIRSKSMVRHNTGAVFLKDAQLTAKGLASIRQPLDAGDTIEGPTQDEDNSIWSTIVSYLLRRPNRSKV